MEKTWRDYLSLHLNPEGARAAFEYDCKALLQAMFPDESVMMVRANPGDEGIDVFIGDIGLAPIDVYQCKFFLGTLGDSQKDQIRSSFNRAAKSGQFQMKKWVLCAPIDDFDLQENIWWAGWKAKQEQQYGIPIRLMNGNDLIHKLKQVGQYRQVFQLEDSIKIAAVHGAVVGPGGLTEASLQMNEQLAQMLAKVNALTVSASHSADIDAMLNIAEQEFIRRYKSRTALQVLTQLGEHLHEHHGSNAALMARYEYLLNVAHRECGEATLARPHALEAHRRQGHNQRYAASAAVGDAEQGNLEGAQLIARHLLGLTPNDAVAHAIIVFGKGASQLAQALKQVPTEVTQDPRFKLTLLDLLEQVDAASAALIVGNDIKDFPCPDPLTFDTERYWIMLAQLIVQLIAGKAVYQNLAFEPRAVEEGMESLRRAYEVLSAYTHRLLGTEKYTVAGNALFFRGLAGYYLTGNAGEFDEYQAIFFQQPLTQQRRFGALWANLLARWDKPEAVLAVLDVLDTETDPNAEYLRALQLRTLDQADEARASLARDLSRASVIEATIYTRATLYLLLYCPTTEERQAFVNLCQSRGQLTQELPAKLLQAMAMQADENRQEEFVQLLDRCAALGQQQSNPFYTLDIAELYHLAKEYDKSLATLNLLPADATEQVLVMGERLYIENLYEWGKGGEELLQRLKKWRLTRPAELKYCFWELQIAEVLNDSALGLEVATHAHNAFPDDSRLHWKYLHHLYLQGQLTQLRAKLEQLVEQPTRLGRPQLMNAAALAKMAGWHRLSLAILYPLACDRQDIQARDKFFHLALLSGDDVATPPSEVAVGTTVVFTVDGQLHPPLPLTPAVIHGKLHPFANQLMGLRAGDTLTVTDSFQNRIRHVEMLNILDAHTALFQDIMRQNEEQEGLFSFQTLKLKNPGIEELQRVLIEQFGAQEQARHDAIRKLLAECATGESGFSAVARGVCSGNGLDGYQLLTSSESAGFYISPLAWYHELELTPNLTYVLDWSTLPLFYELHQAQLLTLPQSLWVASQVPNFLQDLIAEKEQLPESRLSLSISKDAVRGIPYSETYKQDELRALRKLLAWVQEHCQWRPVPEKLDVVLEALRQEKDWQGEDERDYFAGVMDTIFIADHANTVLVSDDMVINELLRRNGSLASSEKFLRAFAGEKFNPHILPILLQKRYVGLAVEAHVLLQLFFKAGGSFQGEALQYLESVSLIVRESPLELLRLHQFLQKLYLLESLTPAQLSIAAVTVYVHALRHLNPVPELRAVVRECIHRFFHLLPIHRKQIKQDFELAWQQLSNGKLLR